MSEMGGKQTFRRWPGLMGSGRSAAHCKRPVLGAATEGPLSTTFQSSQYVRPRSWPNPKFACTDKSEL